MPSDSVTLTLSANVSPGDTFTASYPTGRSAKNCGTDGHQITSQTYRVLKVGQDFTLSFGTSDITVTSQAPFVLTAGTQLVLTLDRLESTPGLEVASLANPAVMSFPQAVRVNLRSPATADPDGYVASQAATAAGGLATGINGALASGGVGSAGVTPRNVVAAWTGAAAITLTGTDEYGAVIEEISSSGTSFVSRKAFATLTDVAVSADVTGLTVGTGPALGLPVYIGAPGDVLREMVDGAAAAVAGTVVAGDAAEPSATTGDARGTYAPNSAPNGARSYELIVAARNSAFKGVGVVAAPPVPPSGIAPPVNTVLPTIIGTAQEGQTLMAVNGTWTNNPTGYAYVWLADDVAISGATASTYLLTGSEVGAVITVQVTASNAAGAGTPAVSAGTATVIAAAAGGFAFHLYNDADQTTFTAVPNLRVSLDGGTTWLPLGTGAAAGLTVSVDPAGDALLVDGFTDAATELPLFHFEQKIPGEINNEPSDTTTDLPGLFFRRVGGPAPINTTLPGMSVSATKVDAPVGVA